MNKQTKFEKNVYEIIGSIGSCVLGGYALLMLILHGSSGIMIGMNTLIKIGISFSLVMMICSVILSIRRFLMLNHDDEF